MTIDLVCPKHGIKLSLKKELYVCPSGCEYPVVNSIPRFVPDDVYASSFGLQWNEYRTTQLDSHTGLPISESRLRRILGGSLDIVKGKTILEAGCGAGRFTEILLSKGANVIAVDLSSAVEANRSNCGSSPNHLVLQADILNLPFQNGSFDMVVCIGVIQHTPDPEITIAALCKQLKPGGLLFIDHYSPEYNVMFSRRLLRSFLLKRSPAFALRFCRLLVSALWPFHILLWRLRKLPLMDRIRGRLLPLSPVVDYHDAYGELGPELLKTWAALDTHDTLTDHYKHLRSIEQIRDHLVKCGMTDIVAYAGGNGVEARARKPLTP